MVRILEFRIGRGELDRKLVSEGIPLGFQELWVLG
jgi:hypothetical protein